ncbi:MAG: TIGR02281 family clan AA aspartic protease [Pseudomonadota bacterium]
MLFWPLTIIGTVILAIFVATHPDVDLTSPKDEDVTALYLVLMVGAIALAAVGRMVLRSGQRTLINGMVLSVVGILGAGGYIFWDEFRDAWNRVRGELNPSLALTIAPGEVEIRRAWDGHYRADIGINGHKMRMIVDTGASMVLIPFEHARLLGIDPDLLRYSLPVLTANGPTKVAPINLDRMEVGPILVRDVIAAVATEGSLESPLLGMSFLSRLTETTFRSEKLILRQSVTDRGVMMLDR